MPSQNCLCVNGQAGQLSSQTKPCLSAYQLQTPAPVLLTTDMQGQLDGSTSRALLPEQAHSQPEFVSIPCHYYFVFLSIIQGLLSHSSSWYKPNSHSYCVCIYLYKCVAVSSCSHVQSYICACELRKTTLGVFPKHLLPLFVWLVVWLIFETGSVFI